MRIPGSEFGSRWDIEFTFEPTDHIRDVLVSAFARLSRDTLRFEAMNTFDPGVWRIDIRLEAVPVPGLVCSLVVGGTPHSGFGISSAVEDVATTVEIASYFAGRRRMAAMAHVARRTASDPENRRRASCVGTVQR